MFKELYPASMNDIQMWNIRELRLCLEWAKTFDQFQKLSDTDQFAIVRNFAFTYNILNRFGNIIIAIYKSFLNIFKSILLS